VIEYKYQTHRHSQTDTRPMLLHSVTIGRRCQFSDDRFTNYENSLVQHGTKYIDALQFRKKCITYKKTKFLTISLIELLKRTCPACKTINSSSIETVQSEISEINIFRCQSCNTQFTNDKYEMRIPILLEDDLRFINSRLQKSFGQRIKSFVEKNKNFYNIQQQSASEFERILDHPYSILVARDKLEFAGEIQSTLRDRFLISPPPRFNIKTITDCNSQLNLILNKKPLKTRSEFVETVVPEFINNGRLNCFRRVVLSRRSFHTGRCVIVPSPNIASNEIILNSAMYSNLGEPLYILALRYPVIDLCAFSFHKVVSTWNESAIGINPVVLYRNQGDFDGDCLNIYSLHSSMAIAEAMILINPKYSFLSMSEPKLTFTHDQLLFNFMLTGRDATLEARNLRNHYLYKSSPYAFNRFEERTKELDSLYSKYSPTISYEFIYNFMTYFIDPTQIDLNTFVTRWKSSEYFKTSVLNLYLRSQCNRLQIEHVFQMMSYLHGLDKAAYLADVKQSRKSLSKGSLQVAGYSTHKMSYMLPEITYLNHLAIYQKNIILGTSLRRLFISNDLQYSAIREIALYRLVRRLYLKNK
jgi:hypothetical protein